MLNSGIFIPFPSCCQLVKKLISALISVVIQSLCSMLQGAAQGDSFLPAKVPQFRGGWRDRIGLCWVPWDRNLDPQQTEKRKWLLLRETNRSPGRQAVALVFLPSACLSAREKQPACLCDIPCPGKKDGHTRACSSCLTYTNTLLYPIDLWFSVTSCSWNLTELLVVVLFEHVLWWLAVFFVLFLFFFFLVAKKWIYGTPCILICYWF